MLDRRGFPWLRYRSTWFRLCSSVRGTTKKPLRLHGDTDEGCGPLLQGVTHTPTGQSPGANIEPISSVKNDCAARRIPQVRPRALLLVGSDSGSGGIFRSMARRPTP